LFAEEGANVVLADINLEAADKVAALIKQRSPNVNTMCYKADVASEKDVKGLVDATVSRFGRLDVMFNNAGE
jgi:NAD(P)-dependent dehydrogenase (short-subunit alcohol dehydrogenase family)